MNNNARKTRSKFNATTRTDNSRGGGEVKINNWQNYAEKLIFITSIMRLKTYLSPWKFY